MRLTDPWREIVEELVRGMVAINEEFCGPGSTFAGESYDAAKADLLDKLYARAKELGL